MKNLEILEYIKIHEVRLKILKKIKSINEDIEIYTYCLSGIKKNSEHINLRIKLESKTIELNNQKKNLIQKYQLI